MMKWIGNLVAIFARVFLFYLLGSLMSVVLVGKTLTSYGWSMGLVGVLVVTVILVLIDNEGWSLSWYKLPRLTWYFYRNVFLPQFLAFFLFVNAGALFQWSVIPALAVGLVLAFVLAMAKIYPL